MNEPNVKYFSGDRMVISCGMAIVECQYWVQWGEKIWNVEIIKAEGKPDDDAALAELIVRALHGTANGRLVITRTGKIIFGSKKTVSTSLGEIV